MITATVIARTVADGNPDLPNEMNGDPPLFAGEDTGWWRLDVVDDGIKIHVCCPQDTLDHMVAAGRWKKVT